MKTIIIIFATLIFGMMFLHDSLQNGRIMRYIDEHPHDRGVPKATYLIGQGYYLFQDLPNATTYFLRVAQRYPDLPMGDEAYFSYLQCLDDNVGANRADLIDGYKAYLEKYPNGTHAEIVKTRLGSYTTGH